MFRALIHRLQSIGLPAHAPAISRRCWRFDPASLLRGLPALGCVLYLPMRPCSAGVEEMPRGLLVEDMRLMPLLQTHWLVSASVIGVDGPREWIECVDRDGHLCARLHLLPDTDYLAWDALLASGGPPMTVPQGRWPQHVRPACAQLLRFRLRRLAGLSVLAGETSLSVSTLSQQLAGQVAGAEAIPLQMTADG